MLRLIYRLYRIYIYFVRPVTVGVRVILLRGANVLLVRQTYMEGWFLPGGGMKKHETFDQAARREAREEVGADIRSLALVGAYSNFGEWKSDHNIVFSSRQFKLNGKHDHEIAELRFFPLHALPVDLWPPHRRRLDAYRLARKRSKARYASALDSTDVTRFGEW